MTLALYGVHEGNHRWKVLTKPLLQCYFISSLEFLFHCGRTSLLAACATLAGLALPLPLALAQTSKEAG